MRAGAALAGQRGAAGGGPPRRAIGPGWVWCTGPLPVPCTGASPLGPAPSGARSTCTPQSASASSSRTVASSAVACSSVTSRVMVSVATVWNMPAAPSLVWSARTITSAAASTMARSTLADSMFAVDSPRSAVSPLPEMKALVTLSPCRDCSAPLPTSA